MCSLITAIAESIKRSSVSSQGRVQAPHPIPEGSEHKVCPITGLFVDADDAEKELSTAMALAKLESDPDIIEERKMILQREAPVVGVPANVGEHIFTFVRLNVSSGAHKANSETRSLVRAIGGLPTLRRFTTRFYKKAFADPHLDQFIRKHSDPHGERFASWIVEKFGDGTPWTDERATREADVMRIGNQLRQVAHDRSSAHFAAWHSPKRQAHEMGQHFKPVDARHWMRLHFWAAREAGLFEPGYAPFMDYYIRFIGHFISVYSSKAPPFTRESVRWSANPQNISRYVESGNRMSDVVDTPLDVALAALPQDEREYTGSKAHDLLWPYGESF